MQYIRQAAVEDLSRIAEMEIFNYRLNFYPIFQNDDFYFNELQVPMLMEQYKNKLDDIWVYDDAAVKGFLRLEKQEIKKLFVEPVLQRSGIGSHLLRYAMEEHHADSLWALEKNIRAIRFYQRHGFHTTEFRKPEDGTTEYLIRMKR